MDAKGANNSSAPPPHPPEENTAARMKALFQKVFDERVARGDSPTAAAGMLSTVYAHHWRVVIPSPYLSSPIVAAALRTVKAKLSEQTDAGEEEQPESGRVSCMVRPLW